MVKIGENYGVKMQSALNVSAMFTAPTTSFLQIMQIKERLPNVVTLFLDYSTLSGIFANAV